ncbi:MAG: class I SAM-dependent methyltransferase [Gemmatimonadaceae bacterium]
MTTNETDQVDWNSWLERWDAQQSGYVPEREERFRVMLDVLEALLPDEFVALDLACGPGAISQRLLARFPAARCVAIDMDPVMLTLGQGALGTLGARVRWVDADLAAQGWVDSAGEASVDAVLSTTALHWLSAPDLFALYRQLGALVRPGGVFLNGDNMDFGADLPTVQRIVEEARDRDWSDQSFAARGIETAEQWWDALAREPSMTPLIAERGRRLAAKERPAATPSLDQHVAALRDAGFREVATLWQSGTDRVLLAIR